MASSAFAASTISNDARRVDSLLSGRLSMVYCNRASLLASNCERFTSCKTDGAIGRPEILIKSDAVKRFAAVLLLLAACNREQKAPIAAAPIGNVESGRRLVQQYGCTSCHDIPGVSGPRGSIGPALTGVGARPIIAGKLPNTPPNMIKYLQNPQSTDPANAMPNLGLTEAQARDVAAFMDTLK